MRKVFALLLLAAPMGVAHAQAAPTMKIKEETPGLLKTAKITPEAATRTAAARVPTGHIRSAEIEKEDGKLIYSFDVAVPKQSGVQEVNVDATTGNVIAVEHESPATERHEKAKDQKHGAMAKDSSRH